MNTELARLLTWLRRYPFCVTCALVSLILAGTCWVLWQRVGELREVVSSRAQEGENMLATRVSGITLRSDLAYVREYTKVIEDNLLVADNPVENKGYFYRLEKQARVSLTDVQQLPAPPADTDSLYRRIPFALKLTGGYDQLAAFLRAVETGPRLSNVTSFSFRRNAPPSLLLTLDLTVEQLAKP
ncbi:MAG TPA: type 4a pilus biogenesis protein PilO [Opitutaceae bacterium]|nr:type 4a pilus biogenesis protein PilO [Opitutaceae bacterium]